MYCTRNGHVGIRLQTPDIKICPVCKMIDQLNVEINQLRLENKQLKETLAILKYET